MYFAIFSFRWNAIYIWVRQMLFEMADGRMAEKLFFSAFFRKFSHQIVIWYLSSPYLNYYVFLSFSLSTTSSSRDFQRNQKAEANQKEESSYNRLVPLQFDWSDEVRWRRSKWISISLCSRWKWKPRKIENKIAFFRFVWFD